MAGLFVLAFERFCTAELLKKNICLAQGKSSRKWELAFSRDAGMPVIRAAQSLCEKLGVQLGMPFFCKEKNE